MGISQVVLGVSGGIAAYKTPDIVRLLRASGRAVQVVLTDAAQQFVTPTTLSAVAGERVRTSLWDEDAELQMGHIELARWADLLLVAPATADVIARFANGLAPDLLTTLYLATDAHVVVAPAMNQAMWSHVATQRNVERLVEVGVTVVGPAVGEQACGDVGPGRMSEPQDIVSFVEQLEQLDTTNRDSQLPLQDVPVLVTAGPTREAIDPVRYISNASSGRQGFAIAKAARDLGASVTLVSGPVALPTPAGVRRIDVLTAAQMKTVVLDSIATTKILFAVAAVADYRPKYVETRKIKKDKRTADDLTLELIENDDIVHSVATSAAKPYLVGFAAETHNVEQYAREKRARKEMDVIVLNDVSSPDIGFDSEDNAVTFITEFGERKMPRAPKAAIAREVVTEVAKLYQAQVERLANGAASTS